MARLGSAWLGSAWLGLARRGGAGRGKAGQGKAWRGRARLGKAGLGDGVPAATMASKASSRGKVTRWTISTKISRACVGTSRLTG